MRVIRSLLIANRGEIARRIIRTARSMGIRTIAVFAADDAKSPFVREADSAHFLPNGYLDQDQLLAICQNENADAIHPGYGFLSENAGFAQRVAAAGRIFVGPPVAAMERMGEKNRARSEARAAGVPLLPGEEFPDGALLSADERQKLAERIGLPLVIKASAGGGGKAQAIVTDFSELHPAWEKVLREAERLYRNRGVVVERYLLRARHIEVQLLGNAAGKNFVISDRDCSAQRLNQKVIEEAPAPELPEPVRQTLHTAAVRLAEQVGYSNAGTMEFLYDPETQGFYFLEMNTRLQVEHPVTEMVTGLDLVREQLLIAQGMVTDYSAVATIGHAIEARICAEKSDGSWQPATGTIVQYHEPRGVRVDSGIEKGSIISGSYDSMLAKVIVHAANRKDAIGRLHRALSEFVINGIHTNIPLLLKLLEDPEFQAMRHYTRYLQTAFVPPQSDPNQAAAIAAIIAYQKELAINRSRFGDLFGFSNVRL
ncbi:MAG: ATP-grasp domain-containing protein [Leptospiraceae bacterium]|nr:ATP-grasp domain-containing protein [Leptospiraceae bacterium]